MNTLSKKKNIQIVFISYERNEDAAYLISLLKRHPEICLFDETDQLIDNLLKFPNASFGINNTIFFELLFEFFSGKWFLSSSVTPAEFEEVSQSKNCYDAFLKIMELYCIKTKPAATIVAYRLPEPANFKTLFSSYVIKNIRAKYIHLLTNEFVNETTTHEASDNMLSAICNRILQVKQKNFVLDYEYEYKRLFRFLNATFAENSVPVKKNKKWYKKSIRLAEVQSAWFNQIISENEKIPDEILVNRVFTD